MLPYTTATVTTTLATIATSGKIGRPARRSPTRPTAPAMATAYQANSPAWPSAGSLDSTSVSRKICSWGW